MIDAFGSPAEKLVLALIQECIAQIWPEATGMPSGTEAESHRRIVAVRAGVRPGNARGI
jgi:hypothetical protein